MDIGNKQLALANLNMLVYIKHISELMLHVLSTPHLHHREQFLISLALFRWIPTTTESSIRLMQLQ